ncbi:MAG: RNA polymerase sigma factor [Bacteroidales bacterium]|jgi:RNA polymerase sigma-70 factor (ECF subfamily)|nr:RNA polymerase sigma factor [Bacteroidales bacterium]
MTVREYNCSVEKYADAVYRFVVGNINDRERANDIVQDAYEKLWRNVVEIEFAVAKPWLFSTAYNVMIDILRKEKRAVRMEEEHERDMIYYQQYSDLNEILHRALDRLPEQQKSVIMLRDYEGYSYKEIGEITGMSEAQVKISIYRGRIALKSYVGTLEAVI